MKMQLIFLYAFIFIVSVSIISCGDNDNNPTVPTTSVKTLTMNHWGVDFSEGKVGSMNNYLDPGKVDGETISWCEYATGNNIYGALLAFRPSSAKMYKVTAADLAGVTAIDTSKWNQGIDCGTVKLKPGEIWVIKAADGYVAFKVITAPQDSASIAASPDWDVKVDYKFSSTLKF